MSYIESWTNRQIELAIHAESVTMQKYGYGYCCRRYGDDYTLPRHVEKAIARNVSNSRAIVRSEIQIYEGKTK